MSDDRLRLAVEQIERLAPGGRPVPIRTPLEADECRWFLTAAEAGIVEFQECPQDCFRYKKWGAKGPDHFETPSGKPRHLFSKPTAEVAWLNREYIPHLAAYARAILDFGLNRSRSSLSLYRTYSKDLLTKKAGGGFETDAEFYDADGSILVQIEAKADSAQTERLAAQIAATQSLGALPAKAAKEIEYVLDLSPTYLWVVGPGSVEPASHLYRVHVDGLDAAFEPIDALPPLAAGAAVAGDR